MKPVFVQTADRGRRLARYRALRALFKSYTVEKSPDSRAQRLLREWLSPDQRVQFDREGRFEVTGCKTGKRYRIVFGSCANVYELDAAGEHVVGLCFVPAGHLVPCDVMLAQKIAIETCEAEALRRANSFPPLAMRPLVRRARSREAL